jgi:TPR repeat protein
LPQTADGLLKAEMLCDRKKSYDECSRAAESLEKGTTGPADPILGRRFRRIALTHLVRECEAGDPHACFVMAAKYREGTELEKSVVRAVALEKRAADLCRFRSAPECPPR